MKRQVQKRKDKEEKTRLGREGRPTGEGERKVLEGRERGEEQCDGPSERGESKRFHGSTSESWVIDSD